MPGNPAANKPGDTSGLWRVEIKNDVTGSTEYEYPDLPYDEARRKADKLQKKLNS